VENKGVGQISVCPRLPHFSGFSKVFPLNHSDVTESDITARCSCTFLSACVLESNMICLPSAEDQIAIQAGHVVMMCLLSSRLRALTSRDQCSIKLLTSDCKTYL